MIPGIKKEIKKVLLLTPPMRIEQVYGSLVDFGSISPPTGLCYIAGTLRAEGYEVSILDSEALKLDLTATIEEVVKYKPDLIGISCKTLWVASGHRLAMAIKEKLPDVLVLAGGHHVSALPERTLDELPGFDILILGEGEITIKELLKALIEGKNLRNVAGLAFKENNEKVITSLRERVKNLDDLPYPGYDLLPEIKSHYIPVLNNIEKLPAFSIMFSRGCSGRCKFCDRSIFGNYVTRHSPEYIINIIKKLYNDHGIRYLVFDDDNMLLSKEHLLCLLDLMIKERVKMPFSCESRIDTIDEERLFLLRKAGCKQIMYGIESGSQKILDMMNKKITTDQIKKAIKLTKKFGIKTLGYIMIGFPGETKETMQETVNFIRKLNLDDISVQAFTPLPGSEIYQFASEYGTYNENWENDNSLDRITFIARGLTEIEIKECINKCYSACYDRFLQYFLFFKRIHTFKHLKFYIKYLFKPVKPLG